MLLLTKMSIEKLQVYCGMVLFFMQVYIVSCSASSGCDRTTTYGPFGEVLALAPIVGTTPTAINCSWTFTQPLSTKNPIFIVRMVVLRLYKDVDSIVLPDGKVTPKTNIRSYTSYTPSPLCYGFVKEKSNQHGCFDLLAEVCNDTYPKIATSWPPKISIKSQEKGQYLFSYAFLECPKTKAHDPAPAVLGVLFAITFVMLAVLIYVIMRKKFIKGDKLVINEYATASYDPMSNSTSHTGTLQLPAPGLPERSISVQSHLSNLQVVSQHNGQNDKVPVSDIAPPTLAQRQISEPKATSLSPPPASAPLSRTPTTMTQYVSTTSSSTTGNGGAHALYQNTSTNDVYEMPMHTNQVEYLDFNETQDQSGSEVYVKDVREG